MPDRKLSETIRKEPGSRYSQGLTSRDLLLPTRPPLLKVSRTFQNSITSWEPRPQHLYKPLRVGEYVLSKPQWKGRKADTRIECEGDAILQVWSEKTLVLRSRLNKQVNEIKGSPTV